MFNEIILNKIGITIEDINFINDLVYKSGQRAFEIYNKGYLNVKTKETPDDLVTIADKELSLIITKAIKNRFPDDIIISEEEENVFSSSDLSKAWVIDPIDGTDNYVRNDGQYSVMIGILKEGLPVAGWVYSPIWDKLILGIPGSGVYRRDAQSDLFLINNNLNTQVIHNPIKIMMGRRDRRDNPDITNKLSDLEFIEMGSLGLKVILILENIADIFIHMSKKLKLWDTVAPSAIALASGMHVSTIEGNEFAFSLNNLYQKQTYVVGKKQAFEKVSNILINNK